MWLFGVVAVVTCTPWIRTCLEKTFSQVIVTLPCIFILPAIALLLTLLWAFVCVDIDPTESFLETPKKKTSLQFHLQKSFSSSPKQQQRLYRTRCLCSSPSSSRRTSSIKGLMTNKTWWTLMYLSSLFPLASSINSDFELERQGNLTQLRQGPNLVECNYAKKKECLNNPSSIPELGTYIQKPGHCVVMEKAFVEGVTYPLASYPNQYFPMSVEKAYKSGMSNNYSEWSQQNQQQFKVDCPLLYNDIVANGQELMCCSEDQFIALHDQVSKIPGSCTSCKKNLRNIWCQFTCNPSNSMFLDIQQVRIMPGDGKNAKKLYPAVEQVTYYMGDDMLRDIYDFCEKDTTIFAVLCSVASKCKNGHGIVDYMGTYRFNSLGSPSSISFKTVSEMNKTQQETSLCKCTEDPKDYVNCISPLDNRLENCVDTCGSFCGVSKNEKRSYSPACYGTKSISSEEKNGQASANKVDTKWVEFQQYLAEGLETTDFTVLNYIVVIVSCLLAVGMIMVYALSLRKVHNTATTTAATTSDRAIGGTSKQMSKVDEIVSGLMRSWGRRVSSGRYPWIILGSTLLVVTTFSLGLSQVEIETDPVKLWVASSRLSYQERQRYGELFMPFYRTEQMVLIAKDGGEVTRQEYLKEAIRVQEIFTNLATHNENNTKRIMLEDICWKATGTACTINSITQYFQNSMEHFEFYAKFGLVQEHFMACLNTPQYSDLNTCAKIQAQLGRQANETIPSSMSGKLPQLLHTDELTS
jgi:Niemann-Pick C1 protein